MATLKWEEARNTVCVDWNGVLDTYKGYTGQPYPPREGAASFLRNLKKLGFKVVILTSAHPSVVTNWLKKNDMFDAIDSVVNIKVPAIVYLDDRGITFNGDYNEALRSIVSFKAWWEDGDHVETPIRHKKIEDYILEIRD